MLSPLRRCQPAFAACSKSGRNRARLHALRFSPRHQRRRRRRVDAPEFRQQPGAVGVVRHGADSTLAATQRTETGSRERGSRHPPGWAAALGHVLEEALGLGEAERHDGAVNRDRAAGNNQRLAEGLLLMTSTISAQRSRSSWSVGPGRALDAVVVDRPVERAARQAPPAPARVGVRAAAAIAAAGSGPRAGWAQRAPPEVRPQAPSEKQGRAEQALQERTAPGRERRQRRRPSFDRRQDSQFELEPQATGPGMERIYRGSRRGRRGESSGTGGGQTATAPPPQRCNQGNATRSRACSVKVRSPARVPRAIEEVDGHHGLAPQKRSQERVQCLRVD